MPKPGSDLPDARRLAVLMALEEDIGALCRIILPDVLSLNTLAEKRDPERIQGTPQFLVGSTGQTIDLQSGRTEFLNEPRYHF